MPAALVFLAFSLVLIAAKIILFMGKVGGIQLVKNSLEILVMFQPLFRGGMRHLKQLFELKVDPAEIALQDRAVKHQLGHDRGKLLRNPGALFHGYRRVFKPAEFSLKFLVMAEPIIIYFIIGLLLFASGGGEFFLAGLNALDL